MSGVGVIALDPVRLGGLEVYMQGLADGCRRRAARIAADVASTGPAVSVAAEVAELDRLAVLCDRDRDEVLWRRQVVEQIPGGVPPTSWASFAAPVAEAAVDVVAARVVRAMEAGHPTWDALEGALEDVVRVAGSEALSARFLVRLTARRLRGLHALLDRLARDGGEASGGPGPAAARAAALQGLLATVVRDGSRHTGEHALGEGWYDTYLGIPPGAGTDDLADGGARTLAKEVKAGLATAGYGLFAADKVAMLAGAGLVRHALAPVTATVGVAKAGLSLADGDGAECDAPEAGLNLLGAGFALASVVVSGGATIPLAAAAGATSGLGLLFGACRRQEGDAAQRRYDPGTGTSTYSGGNGDSSSLDPAGVPLPVNMARSG
jgi:hypothetical protein